MTTSGIPESLVPPRDDERTVLLSVIIPTYNGREVTRGCIESIYAYPPQVPFEIIVVDDASSDGTFEMVRDQFPAVCLIRNEINRNYGASNNRAMQEARGEFFYLLNNDTLMTPNALDLMVGFLQTQSDAGGVGSKLLNEDGSVQWSVKSLPNPGSALFGGRSPLTRMFPNNRFSKLHLLHSEDPEASGDPFVAPYVSSASYMIKRAVFETVGGLDERLTYHVDADYCKRVSDAGWNSYYLPCAVVVHLDHQGGTLVNTKRRMKAVIEFHRGSYIYYRKHMMRRFWEPMHLFVIAGLSARFVVSLLRRLGQELKIQTSGKTQLSS